MLIDEITSQLTKSFGEMLRLVQIKPNVFQVYLPYFHTDGDMIDIFIDVQNENQIVVKDFGQTMMRLSYDIDIDTDTRKSIFNTIIASYKVNFDNTNGIIYAMVEGIDNLLVGIMEMIAVITKVSDIAFLKEERTKNMFYKVFDAFIDDKLKGYKIIKQHSFDFDKKGDYKAPYVIYGKNRNTPIILAPILNTDRCNEYMASHWYYKSNNLTFRTIATFYNYEQISSKVFAKCNDIVDKSFSHFDSNQDEIIARIEEYVELF